MRCSQRVLATLAVAAVAVVLGPGAAIAKGPSAGDQQYIDPLSATKTPSTHSSSSSSSSTSSPSATSTPTASAPAVSNTTPATPVSSTTTTTGTSAGDPSGTLPRTGFDAWADVAIGVGMLGSGLFVRRLVRGR